ncbi:MAG: LLM class flavin-dependent oxidoreductase [Alphaproteobacteria bacterium]|nr:LLM class flavin-dependent oxidoreductase [Alphaproteobacteria bacterium]
MHVGMAVVFQNTDRALSDRQIYLNELALADMAEPLGFDSIWSVEHHFTDYTMCPDVVQFLSYMAGGTPSSARWWWCCPGTIRCAQPSRSPCSITCRAAA